MDGIKTTKEKHTPIYLPHDIIENILSRLPVKSLLRFKTVCKHWKATISDPEFAETHLRRYNNSCLLEQVSRTAQLVRFENDGFRVLSAVDYPPAKFAKCRAFSHCDGLLLIPGNHIEIFNTYFLWNPSSGGYKELCYPYSYIRRACPKFGICYDPLVKDYKVVIGDAKSYAVFYCKTNSWSEMKETKASFCNKFFDLRFCYGVPFKGSVYWLLFTTGEEDRCEIVRFDGRDEKFKNIWGGDSRIPNAYLISSTDALYLFPYHDLKSPRKDDHMLIMKKVGGGDEPWIELKVQLPLSFYSVIPLCWTHENKILLKVCWQEKKHLLYDDSRGSFAVVKNRLDLTSSVLFPHMENLFLL